MGLEVTAYTQVQLAARDKKDRAAFIIDGEAISRWPLSSVGLRPGVYVSTGPELEIRVGHLMSYMWWREQLARLGGYTQEDALTCKVTDGPFIEFISFADLHGVISNSASRKLALDFEQFEQSAREIGGDFYALYMQFKRAFEFAQDTGVVSIH
jgi:hypothetical protein